MPIPSRRSYEWGAGWVDNEREPNHNQFNSVRRNKKQHTPLASYNGRGTPYSEIVRSDVTLDPKFFPLGIDPPQPHLPINRDGHERTWQPAVLCKKDGLIKQLLLNRPPSRNALNHDAVRTIRDTLIRWDTHKKSTMAIFVTSTGDDFSSGADYKDLYEAVKRNDDAFIESYMRDLHEMASAANAVSRPYFPIMNGVTMGSGASLALNTRGFCLATPDAILAFPQVGLGLVPDCGATYFLARAPDNMGIFLALTGKRLVGWDIFHAGFATHMIEKKLLPVLMTELSRLGYPGSYLRQLLTVMDACLSQDDEHDDNFALKGYKAVVSRCFNYDTLEEVFEALRTDFEPFSKVILRELETQSPLALKVTWELLKKAKESDLVTCMQNEYHANMQLLRENDFMIGCKARVFQRTRKSTAQGRDPRPNWTHKHIGQVPIHTVEAILNRKSKSAKKFQELDMRKLHVRMKRWDAEVDRVEELEEWQRTEGQAKSERYTSLAMLSAWMIQAQGHNTPVAVRDMLLHVPDYDFDEPLEVTPESFADPEHMAAQIVADRMAKESLALFRHHARQLLLDDPKMAPLELIHTAVQETLRMMSEDNEDTDSDDEGLRTEGGEDEQEAEGALDAGEHADEEYDKGEVKDEDEDDEDDATQDGKVFFGEEEHYSQQHDDAEQRRSKLYAGSDSPEGREKSSGAIEHVNERMMKPKRRLEVPDHERLAAWIAGAALEDSLDFSHVEEWIAMAREAEKLLANSVKDIGNRNAEIDFEYLAQIILEGNPDEMDYLEDKFMNPLRPIGFRDFEAEEYGHPAGIPVSIDTRILQSQGADAAAAYGEYVDHHSNELERLKQKAHMILPELLASKVLSKLADNQQSGDDGTTNMPDSTASYREHFPRIYAHAKIIGGNTTSRMIFDSSRGIYPDTPDLSMSERFRLFNRMRQANWANEYKLKMWSYQNMNTRHDDDDDDDDDQASNDQDEEQESGFSIGREGPRHQFGTAVRELERLQDATYRSMILAFEAIKQDTLDKRQARFASDDNTDEDDLDLLASEELGSGGRRSILGLFGSGLARDPAEGRDSGFGGATLMTGDEEAA